MDPKPDEIDRLGVQACKGRRLTIFDVATAGGSLAGSPLRIVGVVAPLGIVSIDNNGGTAHFEAGAPGMYTVVLITANDAGLAGRMVTVTITVV